MRSALRLCLVTNIGSIPLPQYEVFLQRASQGGVTSVQLREKTINPESRPRAIRIKKITDLYGVPLFINDDVNLAKEIGAHVHLGPSDMYPPKARKILGSDAIIGWSVETLGELERANQMACIDYIGASAVFYSKTKTNCKTYWGLEGLQELHERSRHPVVAIGGINQTNISEVIQYCEGVAVVGAIHDFENPQAAAEDLISQMNQRKSLCFCK